MDHTQILDQVTQEFLTKFQTIFGIVFHTAQTLFFWLAVIELALLALFYVIRRDGLADMVADLIKKLFIVGVFLTIMNNAGTWIPMLINSFIDLGAQSGGVQSLDPSSIADQGLAIAGGILKAIGVWGFVTNFLGAILGSVACVGIICFYGLIAADLAITLIKSYALITLSPLFMAFGAHRFTQNYATNFINNAIALGTQLMVLYVVIGVGSTLGQDWAAIAESAAKNHSIMGFLVILVAAMMYYLIVKQIPPYVSQIISGTSAGSGADAAAGAVLTFSSMTARSMTQVKSTSGMVKAAGGAALTAGGIAGQAVNLAAQSAKQAGARTDAGAAMAGFAGAAKHMGGAMKDNFASGMKGKMNSNGLYRNMANRANSLKTQSKG